MTSLKVGIIIHHCDGEKEFLNCIFKEDQKQYIGRKNCTILLKDPKSSRKHCYLAMKNSSLQIIDRKSKNGVYVNDEKIDKKRNLEIGDKIRVGTTGIIIDTIASSNSSEIENNETEEDAIYIIAKNKNISDIITDPTFADKALSFTPNYQKVPKNYQIRLNI